MISPASEKSYEDEHMRAYKEFEKKYGFFGERLETQHEKEEQERMGGHTVHFPSEITEYTEIEDKYRAEEKKPKEYREQCKDEAFKLFSKRFSIYGISSFFFEGIVAIRQ